jgi:uncharacterized membrane protein (UPF0136 family)
MANTVLWVYIALLLVGGVMGFLKAGSKISLITSVVFSVALALFAAHVINWPRGADVLLVLLLIVFVIRYARTSKFMPSGLLIILSLAALLARFFFA